MSSAGQSSAKPAKDAWGALRGVLCALVALLTLCGAAQASTLSTVRGYKAASRYAMRDVRSGDATGYKVVRCHPAGRGQVICVVTEYDSATVVLNGTPVVVGFNAKVLATLGKHNRVWVTEPGWVTEPFSTR